MSKLNNMRERVHQPFYDHLIRGVGTSAIANGITLFGAANIGNAALTNMLQASQFPSDSTQIIKAVRVAMYFQSTNDDEFNTAIGSTQQPAVTTGTVSDQSRALDLYSLLAYGAYMTFTVGVKPMINAPLWYFPQGGGVSGWSSLANRSIANNGLPSHEAILKLAKDIQVVKRQNISAQLNFYPFALVGQGLGAAGATISAAPSPLDYLNGFDGIKSVAAIIDGLWTRDVQ